MDIFLKGIRSTDSSIGAAKTDVYKDYRTDFDAPATNFLSGLISNIHAGAQIDYANRHSGKRRYVSAVGSNDFGRGGRGRARRGGGRYETGRGGGHGRDGRGRGTPRKTYINNVDVTDPNRNFTSDEWDRLGSLRSYILKMRGNTSGRGRNGQGAGRGNDAGQRNASSATTASTNDSAAQNATNANDHQSVVSEMTERGSQNGRGFGRGAYT